jgi:glycine cleavage system H protein
MPKPLVFLMGRSPAIFPVDRRYAANHMWAFAVEGGYRFGLSAYAVRLLGDVKHVGWSAHLGTMVKQGDPIGYVEASKATSDLFAPTDGRIEEYNTAVLEKPSLVNSHLYDAGWLLRLSGVGQGLISAEEYLAHVEAGWPLAQRLLKGQFSAPRGEAHV